jgi:hypothetical protein
MTLRAPTYQHRRPETTERDRRPTARRRRERAGLVVQLTWAPCWAEHVDAAGVELCGVRAGRVWVVALGPPLACLTGRERQWDLPGEEEVLRRLHAVWDWTLPGPFPLQLSYSEAGLAGRRDEGERAWLFVARVGGVEVGFGKVSGTAVGRGADGAPAHRGRARCEPVLCRARVAEVCTEDTGAVVKRRPVTGRRDAVRRLTPSSDSGQEVPVESTIGQGGADDWSMQIGLVSSGSSSAASTPTGSLPANKGR